MTAAAASRPEPHLVSLLWATVEQAADLAKCHAQLFAEKWDEAAFQQLLSHPGSVALIARHGNPQETVGFIIGQLAADEVEVLSLGVLEPCQRMGLGRRLMEGLQRAAVRGEAKKLFLEVADDNLPALVFYSRLGLKEFGRRKAYYKRPDGQTADALNLTLSLSP